MDYLINNVEDIFLYITRRVSWNYVYSPFKNKRRGVDTIYTKNLNVLRTCRVFNLTEFNILSPHFGRDINTVFVLKMKVNLA